MKTFVRNLDRTSTINSEKSDAHTFATIVGENPSSTTRLSTNIVCQHTFATVSTLCAPRSNQGQKFLEKSTVMSEFMQKSITQTLSDAILLKSIFKSEF